MFIDCHTHTNFKAYKDDAKEVIQRALDEEVWMIQVGSQNTTSERAVKIANEYDQGVFAAVGLHPIHLFDIDVNEEGVKFHTRAEKFDQNFYKQLVQSSDKVVAIGECGLEYYRMPDNEDTKKVKKLQRELFIAHLELVNELDLPIMIHCRSAKEDPDGAYLEILDILSHFSDVRGMIHCFLGSKEVARKFLNRGFYISFGGIVTFKNAPENQELAQFVPLEQMLSETDAPYLTPHPLRGKRNEPLYVKYVVKKLADLKNMPLDRVEQQLFDNARKFFRLA